MLSSACGASDLRPRAAADAEVSAASAAVTGSEVVRLGDRGGTNRGGRVAAATTSSTRVTEGAERRGHSPARKPDPEPGRMDHHQPGTGRYQVVSFWPQPGPPAPPRTPGLPPAVAPRVPFLGLFAEWRTCWLIYFWLFWQDLASFTPLGWSLPVAPLRPFFPHPSLLRGPHPSAVRYPYASL